MRFWCSSANSDLGLVVIFWFEVFLVQYLSSFVFSRWLKCKLELLFSLILLSNIFNVWVLHALLCMLHKSHVYDFFWPHPAACGILVSLPDQGWNPCPLHWEHRDLTIGLLGSLCTHMFKISNDTGGDKMKIIPHFPAPTLLLLLFSHYIVSSSFVTPWTAAHQASLSFTVSQSLLKHMSTKSMMPSNHLILCYPLLLLPSVFPSIRVFSSELPLYIRWPKWWSFSFSISPSNE